MGDRLNDACIKKMNAHEQGLSLSAIADFIGDILVYEDDEIMVLNKPAFLLSVDGRTLKVSLQARLLRINPNIRLIHRLDMDTSGLIIFAKTAAAQSHISKQFIAKMVQKNYQALVFGCFKHVNAQGMIDVPVRYEPTTKPKHIVDITWHKNAITQYKILAHEHKILDGITYDITRVQLKPITGRSHQLRLHMVHAGHVMVGDPIYAEGVARHLLNRLALHAQKLRLKHPVHGQWLDFCCDVPF